MYNICALIPLQNPIEPSSNDVFEHVPDSRIDGYRPAYWPFAKPNPAVRDTYRPAAPEPWSYHQASSVFDADFGPPSQYVPPHRLASEDDYKNHLSPSSNAYRQRAAARLMPAKASVAIQLLATTNIFHDYRSPPLPYQSSHDPAAAQLTAALQGVRIETPNAVVFERRPAQAPNGPESFKEQPTTTTIVLTLPLDTPVTAQEPTVPPTPLPAEEVPVIVTETEDESIVAATEEPPNNELIVGLMNLLDSAERNVTKTESTTVAVDEPSYMPQVSVELGLSDGNGWSFATAPPTTEKEDDEWTSVTTESELNSAHVTMDPIEIEWNSKLEEGILQAVNEPSSTTTALEDSIATTEISGELRPILVNGESGNDNNNVTEKQGRERENTAYQGVTVDNISAEFPSDFVIMEYPFQTFATVNEYNNEDDDDDD